MPSFDRFASEYRDVLDGSVGSAAYFADGKASWIAREVGPDFRGRVLDFGCGIGLLAEALARHLPGAHLTGFDVSAQSLAATPAHLRQRVDFTHDPKAMGHAYDLIVISNVLHHIPVAERDGVLADLATRLVSGGKLAIFEHNPLNPVTRVVVARCPFDDDAILLWPREALDRLGHAGLRPQPRAYVAFFPKPLAVLRGLEARLRWCPLGAQYVALGVKP
jgi:SAM-dependent methyltransferase